MCRAAGAGEGRLGNRVPALLAVMLAACTAGPTAQEKEAKDTAVDRTSEETGLRDSDTSRETDEDTDLETDEPDSAADTDTGGGETPIEVDLAIDAAAKLIGEDAGDADGRTSGAISVARAGDVNADGLADLVVGLAGASLGGIPNGGVAYLVHGPVSGEVDLSLADARLYGTTSEYAGMAVASAGDVDGDGVDDLLVGAPYYADGLSLEGRAYLVRGPLSGDRSLAEADAVLHGEYTYIGVEIYSETGESLAGGGDVDGDGYDDVLVGAPIYGGRGAAYLLRGPLSGEVELATEADLRLVGDGLLGSDVAFAGDTDGDGLDDILIGNPFHETDSVLLFLGPVAGAGPADVVFWDDHDDYSGNGARGAGDTNGDGYADVLIDAGRSDDGGESAGAAYLLLGPLEEIEDVDAADARFVGTAEWGYAGRHVDGAGYVDGDGSAEILIGAPAEAEAGPGAVYVFFGPVNGTCYLSDANAILRGNGDDRAGQALAGVGDVDGDGLPDVLIGGPGDDDGGEDAGAAWLVLGASITE